MIKINSLNLMGRLTADPEIRYTPSNTPVTSFNIAADRAYSKGEDKQTDFIPIVAWGKTAELICKYFAKGKPIIINGRLQQRTYKDKDDKARSVIEVIAEKVEFVLSDKTAGGNHNKADNSGYSNSTYKEPDADFRELDNDEDLPF